MKRNKFLPLVLAASIALSASGCGSNIATNSRISEENSSVTTKQTTAATSEKPNETTTKKIPNILEQKIIGNIMTYTKYAITKQAEDGKLSGKAAVDTKREGYYGKGYVTGISAPEEWSMEFEMPQSQYYHVAIAIATDAKSKNALMMDGNFCVIIAMPLSRKPPRDSAAPSMPPSLKATATSERPSEPS